MNRSNTDLEVKKKEQVAINNKQGTSHKKIDSFALKTFFFSKIEDLELTQGDPDGEIIIKDNHGNSLYIKGANAKITKKESSKVLTDNSVSTEVTKDTVSNNLKASKDENIKLDQDIRNTNTKIKRTSIWVSLGIGLGIVVFFIIAYKRRTSIKNLFKK